MADKSQQIINRVYRCDGNDTKENIYPSHTDYIETDYGVDTLSTKLKKIDSDIIDASNNTKQHLAVALKGEITGRAQCSDDWEVVIDTSPTKKYAQKILISGAVTGNAFVDSYENGALNVNTNYDRNIPQTVKLTGNVTGTATVNSNGEINLTTECNLATKIPLSIGSIQWSTNNKAETELAKCFGGKWSCVGNVDIGLGNSTKIFYAYEKISN